MPAVTDEFRVPDLVAPYFYRLSIDDLGLRRNEQAIVFGNLESAQFVAVRTVHAFPVIECDIGCVVFERHRAVERTGRKDFVSVRLVERPVSEAFPYLPFVAWVDIQRVAVIAADCHAAVGDRLEHPALAVPEPRPAGTVDAG